MAMPWRGAVNTRAMRDGLLALAVALTQASSLCAGPAPYSAVKIYAVDLETGSRLAEPPTADYIRANPDIELSIDGGYAATPFFRALHWEKRRYDPAIERRAGRLVMVVDLYDRIQPRRSYPRTSASSLSTVFQLRPVPRVPSLASMSVFVSRERPMPSG